MIISENDSNISVPFTLDAISVNIDSQYQLKNNSARIRPYSRLFHYRDNGSFKFRARIYRFLKHISDRIASIEDLHHHYYDDNHITIIGDIKHEIL